MKKITKKQSKEFNDKVIKAILAAGFENNNDGTHEYTKETHFGLVSISVWNQAGSQIYSVFSRFDVPEKALRIFNCNRFTGKYNFHCSDSQECLNMFEMFLDELDTMVEVDKQIQQDKEENTK